MNSMQLNEMKREGDYINQLLEQMDSTYLNSDVLFKLKADDKSIAIDADTNGTGDTVINKVYLTDTMSKHYVDVIRLIAESLDADFVNILENVLPNFKNVIVIINMDTERNIQSVDVCVTPEEIDAVVAMTNYALTADLSDQVSPVAIGDLVYLRYPFLVDKLTDTSGYNPEIEDEVSDSEYDMDMDEIPGIEDEEEDIYEV